MDQDRISFKDIKIGDIVTRNLAGVIMKLRVTHVDAERIWCGLPDGGSIGGWSFDRITGAEIDDDLGWGPKYGVTGSFLVSYESPTEGGV